MIFMSVYRHQNKMKGERILLVSSIQLRPRDIEHALYSHSLSYVLQVLHFSRHALLTITYL
jgi:hypothetical protein